MDAPRAAKIAGRHAQRTVFTRLIPPARAEDMPGAWRRYFRRWAEMTRAAIDPGFLDLVPSLARLAPSATVIDKHVYSPFVERGLLRFWTSAGPMRWSSLGPKPMFAFWRQCLARSTLAIG